MTAHYCSRIPPFGYLRVNGYLLLTAAFRSLSRPSSAPSAKASALCPLLLNQLSPTLAFNVGLLYCFSLSVKIFWFFSSTIDLQNCLLPFPVSEKLISFNFVVFVFI